MRVENWPERMALLISEASSRQFEWGSFDCVQFAFEMREAITGIKADLPQYNTLLGARRILHKWDGLPAFVAHTLGEPGIEPQYAHRGDIVLVESASTVPDIPYALAVADGLHAWAPGRYGLTAVYRRDWVLAWRVE